MENIKYFCDIELTEQLGIECFYSKILESLRSIFYINQKINEQSSEDLYYRICKNNSSFKNSFKSRNTMPIPLYFNVKSFYEGYLFYAEDFEWNFENKIKKCEDKIDTSFLDKIPFLEYEVLNIKIKYNNKWKRLIQTKNCIILL